MDYIERMKKEAAEIAERRTKLSEFMATATYKRLPDEERALMQMQDFHMRNYYETVARRIELAETREAQA